MSIPWYWIPTPLGCFETEKLCFHFFGAQHQVFYLRRAGRWMTTRGEWKIERRGKDRILGVAFRNEKHTIRFEQEAILNRLKQENKKWTHS